MPEATVVAADEKGQVATPTRRRAAIGAAIVAVIAFSALVVGAAVSNHRPLFAFDEATYADYLIKIDKGQMWMPRGSLYDQEAMRVILCRGIAHPDETRPLIVAKGDCAARARDPAAFLNGGVSTSAGHPPTYFLMTYVGAKAVLLTGVTDDLVTAGRMVGVLWMALGLLALAALARELGASPAASALAVVVAGLSPKFVEEWQYLTPDALNLLIGSLTLLAAVRWLRGTAGYWQLVAVGVAGAAIKFPNVLVVLAAAIAIVVAGRTFRPLAERLRGAAALVVPLIVTTVAVAAVTAVLAVAGRSSPQDNQQYVAALNPRHLLVNLDAFIGPLGRSPELADISSLSFLLILSFLVAAAFSLPAEDVRRSLGAAVLGMFVVGPILLILVVFVAQHQYFAVAERYGFNLLPGAFAIAASYWKSRFQLLAVSLLLIPNAIGGLEILF